MYPLYSVIVLHNLGSAKNKHESIIIHLHFYSIPRHRMPTPFKCEWQLLYQMGFLPHLGKLWVVQGHRKVHGRPANISESLNTGLCFLFPSVFFLANSIWNSKLQLYSKHPRTQNPSVCLPSPTSLGSFFNLLS